jgi:TetR/AcrR family transcriptional repressor of nem operon
MPSSKSGSPLRYSPKALEIIERTNGLLASGGYGSFSYADVAELVAVRKASIHHHFPTKADLVKATVAAHREATQRGLQSLDQAVTDPLERLIAYGRYWAECIQASNPPICICAVLAAELPALPAEVAEEVKAYFADLHSWISSVMEQGQSTGRMRLAGTPAAEASAFMASIYGAMLAARAAGDTSLFWEIANQSTNRLRMP